MDDRQENVVGFIRLPIHRNIGCKIGYYGMILNIPGASWLYFRCLFGGGVDFTTHTVDM